MLSVFACYVNYHFPSITNKELAKCLFFFLIWSKMFENSFFFQKWHSLFRRGHQTLSPDMQNILRVKFQTFGLKFIKHKNFQISY